MPDNALQIDVVIPTQTRYLELIGSIAEQVGRELEQYSGDQEAFAYHLNLVLTEATSNAIRHSGQNVLAETVRVTMQIIDDELVIRVYDHGQGFDLEQVPLPDLDQPKEGGMGLFFIRSLMDSVIYTQEDECNVLEIRKLLKPTSTDP